jgi:putative endonuclease
MAKHNELGKQGEAAAVQFLENKNYTILEQNWRSGKAEIDIVAMDGQTMVFVEVKTRTENPFEQAALAVDGKKQRLLAKAAAAYMIKKEHESAIRFDVVTVLLRGGNFYLDHLEDAFFPTLF